MKAEISFSLNTGSVLLMKQALRDKINALQEQKAAVTVGEQDPCDRQELLQRAIDKYEQLHSELESQEQKYYLGNSFERKNYNQ